MLYNQEDIKGIREFMLAKHYTIAVAESVSSGHLQAALSTAEDASIFFQGGITTYNIHQKYVQLHVDPTHAISCNCVSSQVSEEMAENVCKLFGSDWGIGITGYATPVPSDPAMPLYALASIAFKGEVVKTDVLIAESKDPFEVQVGYVNKILENCLAVFLQEELAHTS
ncbi:MAG TPA: CinA family protein [Ferruginibacter sp.]|nr:CinA family protein [Ferruginibacter sp.]